MRGGRARGEGRSEKEKEGGGAVCEGGVDITSLGSFSTRFTRFTSLIF